jgi:putative SOS response-associated peptidase YedK
VCGRFALFAPIDTLAEYFALTEATPVAPLPRYNLTPGQAVAVVREHEGRRRLDLLRWGLVPHWAKDAAIGRRLINARLDGVAAKPAFREAFARRRCLIAANGFYEWGEPSPGRRRPFFVRASDEPLLALGGLWERWRGADGEPLQTCVIVTTDANATLAPIHERMPVLVSRADQALWLDPRSSPADIAALVTPALDVWPVSTAVNDPRRDDETLIEPARA